MIGIAFLTLSAAAPPPFPSLAPSPTLEPEVENEIVVIGRQLRDWRGSWKLKDGAVVCKTRKSTGDKDIDAIGCDAMTSCMTPLVPEFVALEQMDLSRREMGNRLNAVLEQGNVGQCTFSRREEGIEALAAARRGDGS
ncbi:hypothetical protein EH31_12250 [Erythrobacter longus]|uniref:Uncharacterized protein n=1 Tax=Erythrobacter longus TaxID=1044 RepID=A0A074M437_ERYLO|nr:hypothetical protein [Erythrobacter longus]KEO89411.1 hypothetical protein EH31_12250 [Erythrobacter longus]